MTTLEIIPKVPARRPLPVAVPSAGVPVDAMAVASPDPLARIVCQTNITIHALNTGCCACSPWLIRGCLRADRHSRRARAASRAGILTQPFGCYIIATVRLLHQMEAVMGFPDRIERTVELAHPPGRVWAALTTAEGLAAWFGNEVTIDLRPGGLA